MLHQILCYVKFHAASNFMIPTSNSYVVDWWLHKKMRQHVSRQNVKFSTAISLLSHARNILSGLSNPTNSRTMSATTSSTPKVFPRVSLHHDDSAVLTNFLKRFFLFFLLTLPVLEFVWFMGSWLGYNQCQPSLWLGLSLFGLGSHL